MTEQIVQIILSHMVLKLHFALTNKIFMLFMFLKCCKTTLADIRIVTNNFCFTCHSLDYNEIKLNVWVMLIDLVVSSAVTEVQT